MAEERDAQALRDDEHQEHAPGALDGGADFIYDEPADDTLPKFDPDVVGLGAAPAPPDPVLEALRFVARSDVASHA